jgi:hypothetical protein
VPYFKEVFDSNNENDDDDEDEEKMIRNELMNISTKNPTDVSFKSFNENFRMSIDYFDF